MPILLTNIFRYHVSSRWILMEVAETHSSIGDKCNDCISHAISIAETAGLGLKRSIRRYIFVYVKKNTRLLHVRFVHAWDRRTHILVLPCFIRTYPGMHDFGNTYTSSDKCCLGRCGNHWITFAYFLILQGEIAWPWTIENYKASYSPS